MSLQNAFENLAVEAKQDAQIVRQDALNVLATAIRDLLALIEAQTPTLVGGEVPVTALTDAELRAAPVPVTATISGVATEVTLAALLAKVIAAPSTEAKQDAIITALGGVATQATLAALLAKVIAAPATEAKQDTGNASLGTLVTASGTDGSSPPAVLGGGTGIRGWLRSIYERLTGTLTVAGTVTANTGLAQPLTDAQLRAVAVPVSGTVATGGLTDAQLRASPVPVSGAFSITGGATEAKQDAQILNEGTDGSIPPAVLGGGTGIRGWLRSIYERLTGTLTVGGTVAVTGVATETTLASVLAKIIASPATEAKQDAQQTRLNLLSTEAEQVLIRNITQILADATGLTSSAASATPRGQLGLSIRKDVATPLADTDQEYAPLQSDPSGRLRVIAANANRPLVTNGAGWTTGAQVLSTASDDFASAIILLRGTYATFTPVFELSFDNSIWVAVPVVRIDTRASIAAAGAATGANASAIYSVPVNGFPFLRVRTAAGPSTGTVFVTISLSAMPAVLDIQTVNTPSGTQTVSGSGTFTTSLASTTANIGTAGGLGNTESSTPLGIGGTLTGTTRDLGATLGVYSEVIAMLFADQASAANGAQIQFSTDNFTTNWAAAVTSLVAGTTTILRVPATARYFRVVLINGAVAQTFLRVTSLVTRL